MKTRTAIPTGTMIKRATTLAEVIVGRVRFQKNVVYFLS